MNHLESALGKKNNWWRYLLMFMAIFGGANVIGAVILLIAMVISGVGTSAEAIYQSVDKNLLLLMMVVPFMAALWIFVKLIKPMHGRTFTEVINGTDSIRWKKFFYSFGVWSVIMALYLIADLILNGDNFIFNFSFAKFAILVVISVLFIPFQTTLEEVLFRGYLAQGVAAWAKSRIWAVLVPAFLFGIMHIMNPEIKEYGFWLTMPQYILIGLAYGLVAVLDDGIEVSMGAHAANNIFLSLFVTFKGSVLDTPALFVQKQLYPLKDLITLVFILVIFVIILSVKYKWDYRVLLMPVRKSGV